ncbi:MAG: DUF2889 domain-containing protein [Pseudohongiellaceae bacterium]|nr:DUF2889 domain-containing protein [Pseudohongiellaceae bacterium]
MPLSPPSARERKHTRAITIEGFEREDGLYDIEAHMTDIKTYTFSNKWRGDITPGEALHEMRVRVTVDDNFVVHQVEACTDNSPFPLCPDITPNYEALKGATMSRGWRQRIKEVVGGTAGCTHITELLYPMATVAYQTIFPIKRKRAEESGTPKSTKRPGVINTCHAWAEDSPIVKVQAPDFYTGKD